MEVEFDTWSVFLDSVKNLESSVSISILSYASLHSTHFQTFCDNL